MKTIQVITSYSLSKEPTINDRLMPIIDLLLLKNYRVILFSSDTKKIKKNNFNFQHILASQNLNLKKNIFFRLFYELRLSFKLIRFSKQNNGDLIFITIPSIFLLFFTFKLRSRKLHLDFRDLVWEYMFKNELVLKIINLIIKKNLNYVSSISYTNEAEFKKLSKFGFKKDTMHHISNGVLEKKFKKLKNIKTEKKKIPLVSYIGKIGLAQDLKTFLNVAELMPKLNFQITGQGIDLEYLKKLVKKKKIKNVKFTGFVKWKDILNIYNKSDILFLQLRPNFNLAFPSKLYEYLSTGKFIIFSSSVKTTNTLKKFNNIKTVEYGNLNRIAEVIRKHINSKNFRKISEQNKTIIKNEYLREKWINKFINSIELNKMYD